MMVIEIVVGLFGMVTRLMMSMVETAGTVIGMDIGLSNASILNPALASESALPSAFLGLRRLSLFLPRDRARFIYRREFLFIIIRN